MSRWMLEKYTQAATVSCGQYVADFDVKQRMTPVSLSPSDTRRSALDAHDCLGPQRHCPAEVSRYPPKLGSGGNVCRLSRI
jgi:hypothetical protein